MAGDTRENRGMRPLDLRLRSSDEYEPLPLSPVVVEAARRAGLAIDRLARGRAVPRRDLLRSAAASAAVLSALAACTSEKRASQGEPAPGGTFTVPVSADTTTSSTTTTIDPAAASSVLDRDDLVVDVQLHFLDPTRNTGGNGSGFPQAACGLGAKECFAEEVFLDLVFGQSTTRIGVLSGLPITGADSPLALDVMDRARERLALIGGDQRVLLQAPVFPATGELQQALDGMAADAAAHPVAAWKTYTHTPNPYRLDDERGDAFLSQAIALGRPIVAVHKGISGEDPAASPVDVGPAATAHPDATIVVYHSGWEGGVVEGVYDGSKPAGEQRGVDRLLASLDSVGIGPTGNVYAELGSTWFNLARSLDDAAHVLGKLLAHLGPERIVWGTDSIWYGSPQGQIDAFRAFTISEQFQEQFGYPAITDEAKRLILGGNAARLYGL
jgi:hypothetical protein